MAALASNYSVHFNDIGIRVCGNVFGEAVVCPMLKNTSINRFVVSENEWRLETWGEVSHLKNVTAMDDL